ncbi:MAG: tRNA 2-selenouridine(34) synthase MnmH [Bacteroidia bacterium]
MSLTTSIEMFIPELHSGNTVLLDVRSPKEYLHAHLPGAISLPLMNDEERAAVGITFKKEGREAAIVKGFELAGNRFGDFIKKVKELSPNKEVMMYCWRGGLRSSIMAWVLSTAGFKVTLLKGGYKSFRSWVLAELQTEKNIIVIGGKTGSGKTELLIEIKKAGEQVIDLEKLAHHKGSSFGSLGQPPQPSTEQFENLLAMEWFNADKNKILWLENESLLIGTCAIPNSVFDQIRNAPVIEIMLDYEIRKKRILNEYGHFDKKILAEKTTKVKKRLGGLRLKEALAFLEIGNMENWCDIMLNYYDDTYEHSNQFREKNKVKQIFLENDDMKQHIEKVIHNSQFIMHNLKEVIN